MSTLRLTTISNQTGSASVPSDTVINGSAKAWVNFDGTGTVAIRAAFNVSSITDNGTGDYTVNFTVAMVDANYSAVAVGGNGAIGAGSFNRCGNVGSYLTTSCRVFTGVPASATAADVSFITASVFR
jgi:hypothetical protein